MSTCRRRDCIQPTENDGSDLCRLHLIEQREANDSSGTCPTCCNHADGDCETVRVSRNLIQLLAANRNEAEAALREAAAAFVAKDEERLRLILCDRDARSRAWSLAQAEVLALSRIRAAMEKHGDWTALDTPQGLAASVDTFIETHANLPKVERWYAAAMTRLSHALRMTDEMPYYCNDVAIDRIDAEIERLRRVERVSFPKDAYDRIHVVMLSIARRQSEGWSEMQVAGQLTDAVLAALYPTPSASPVRLDADGGAR